MFWFDGKIFIIKELMFVNVRKVVGLGFLLVKFYIYSFESNNYVIKYKECYCEVFLF